MINEVFEHTTENMDKGIDALKRDFSSLRTGKVTTGIIDNVKVDYYGTMTALNQVGKTNARWLLWKELAVGALNGVLWASVVAVITGFWFQSVALGLLIAAAMIINLIVAALAGASIPLILKRINIDPALAGGVVLTTVTDVVGFLSFLGLATIFLI